MLREIAVISASSLVVLLGFIAVRSLALTRIRREIDNKPKKPMSHCPDCGITYPTEYSFWVTDVLGTDTKFELCPFCTKRKFKESEDLIANAKRV